MDGAHSLIQQGDAERDAKKTLARVQKGEGLRSIGKSLGLSHIGVRKWLLREVGAEYHEMQTDGLLTRVVEADKMLMDARDPVSIARAREIARFARMDLERRRPGLYGAKTQITGDLTVNVTIARGVTLDADIQDVVAEDDVQPQQIGP
jgi:hypothetical protein